MKTLEVKQEQSESGKIILYFEDGSCVLISSASIIFYPDAKYYEAMVEEENGMHQDKNLAGTKFFDFEWNPKKGIEPYTSGWDGTRNNLLNSNSLGCKKEVTNERAYCTKLIQMNGWKIPKDYPLRF